MAGQQLSSFKPYMFTAYYDWLVDNSITPHLLIDTSVEGVQVPMNYAQNNSMILSISPGAIADYKISNKDISFKAMFHGVSEDIVVPFKAMRQLIAVETGGALPIGQALEAFDMDDPQNDLNDEPEFVIENDEEDLETLQQEPQKPSGPAFSFVAEDDEEH